MESEEFEQIPWANLVAEQSDGIDKRVYLAVGLVGLLVVAVFGMRLLGGGSQPTPPVQAIAPHSPVAREVETVVGAPTPMVISEADLMADAPVGISSGNRLVEVTAEWFVTDWFTRDGSQETIRSIREVLSPDVVVGLLPHEAQDHPATFVEWAKAVGTENAPDGGLDVAVAYRAIRETEEGFVREPVITVVVSLTRNGDSILVTVLPRTISD